jgi:signal transduction histidine kinase/ActR/RegA family two-component response regulator
VRLRSRQGMPGRCRHKRHGFSVVPSTLTAAARAIGLALLVLLPSAVSASDDDAQRAANRAFQLLRTNTALAAEAAAEVRREYPDLPEPLQIRMLWVEGAGLCLSDRHRQAIEVLMQAEGRARAAGDLLHLRRALRHLAVSYYETSQFAKGIAAATEGIEISRQLDDQSAYVVRLWNELALNQIAVGRYSAAMQSYESALALLQSKGDTAAEMVVRNNLAGLMAETGFAENAIRHYEMVLSHVTEEGNQFMLAHVKSQLGDVLVQQGFASRGRQMLQEALELSERLGQQDVRALVLGSLGDYARIDGDLDAARAYYEQAESIWQQLENPSRQLDVLGRLVELDAFQSSNAASPADFIADAERHEAAGDFVNAIRCYQQAIPVYIQQEQWQRVAELQETITSLYKESWGEQHSKQLAELNASLQSIEQQRRLDELAAAAAISQTRARQNRLLLIGLAVLFVMLTIVGLALSSRSKALRESRRANAELERERRRQLESDRRLAQQQRTECLELLAAGVAHDFNNCLTAIAGMAELAAMTDSQTEKTDLLQQITTATGHGAGLTSQLVQFLGQVGSAKAGCNVNESINAIGTLLQSVVRGRAVLQISLSTSESLVAVTAMQLQQIAVNLVTNSAEASHEGGCIVLQTGEAEFSGDQLQQLAAPGTAQPGHFSFIRVSDDGCGVPEEIRGRILDPYFSTKRAGRGMGLASVQGVAKAVGGAIDIAASDTGGSVISVYLPVHDSHLASDSADATKGPDTVPVPEADVTGAEDLVLLVDDEPQLTSLMRRLLEHAGFHVRCASGAREALEIVRRHRGELRCVVTDYAMAGETGVWLAEQVRAVDSSISVILCSGFAAQSQSQHEAVAAFLQKPYGAQELIQAISQCIGERTSVKDTAAELADI